MEQKSWVCTVSIQIALCFALYCAINMGQRGINRQSNEIYFISVRGGFRPFKQQTLLLKQVNFINFLLKMLKSFTLYTILGLLQLKLQVSSVNYIRIRWVLV